MRRKSGVAKVDWANRRFCLILAAPLLAFFSAAFASGQGSQPAKNQPAVTTVTASFGPVVPGRLGAPAAVTVPFRVPISQATAALGYRVTAISSFIFTPTMPAAGGKSVTAADLLVGITSVSSTPGAGSSAAIASGFDYDPAAVRGATAGQRATLADLLPGREILRAGRSTAAGLIPAAGGALTLNVAIAVPSRFFTPGSFSGTISLIVSQ